MPAKNIHWVTVLVLVMITRLVTAVVMPITPEEAYHWNFARHLDWSFYDHPPMVAWGIALGRLIGGDTVLGIRLVSLLFSLGTAVVLAQIARHFYRGKAASWTVFLLGLSPCLSVVGSWGFPDSPLLFFWASTMALVWQALEKNRRGYWLLAGAALGGGMLSKYTAAFLVPSLFGYLLFCRSQRRWLASPWPYLAGVVSLVVFFPVLYWNWKHDWVSFYFQSTARFQSVNEISWLGARNFIGEQWLCMVPLTLPLALVAWWRGVRSGRRQEHFLLWMFMPMFVFFGLFSLTSSYHLLWPLPAYLALTVFMAGALVQGRNLVVPWYRARVKWITGLAALAWAVVLVLASCGMPGIPHVQEVYGWDEVAARARQERRQLPDGSFYLSIGARSYPFPSQLALHLGAPEEVHAVSLLDKDALHYRYWDHRERLLGKDAVVVMEDGLNPGLRDNLGKYFRSVEPAGEIDVPFQKIPLGPQRLLRFLLYRGYGYRGSGISDQGVRGQKSEVRVQKSGSGVRD